jgi:large subunit ribosomal protein L18
MRNSKISSLKLRHFRLRKKVSGSSCRPRLCVHFSGKHIYAQVIDDSEGVTIVSASTTEKSVRLSGVKGSSSSSASQIGKLVADRAIAREVVSVVFDRGGFRFHGKVKALADAARANGLSF